MTTTAERPATGEAAAEAPFYVPDLIRLDVARGSRVVVVSDLHLAPVATEVSTSAATELAQVLGSFHLPGLLVIAGDGFEMLAAAPDMAGILDAHPQFTDAVKGFAADKNHRVVVTPGNHDGQLAWDEESAAVLRERLGATDMALACDFRMGVKGMRFFMPAARFGLHYYPSGMRRYTQKVSPSFAKRAFLLSEDFSDEDLLRVGYLDWLVDRADFKARIDETANRLAGLAPLSMVNMKRAIEQFAQAEPDIPRIRAGIKECQVSEDLREGLAALKEKRPPAFKGR